MEIKMQAAEWLTTEDVLLVLQDRLERYKRKKDLENADATPDGLLALTPPTDNSAPRVTLTQLAERLQMDRSSCRKYLLKSGYKPEKMRTADSGFQTALTVTELEARAIQAARAKDGYCSPPI